MYKSYTVGGCPIPFELKFIKAIPEALIPYIL